MTTPKWLSTTLSFILIIFLFAAYFVTRSGDDHSPQITPSPTVQAPTNSPTFIHPLTIGKTAVHVAYATTPQEQEQGLSNTTPLTATEGMLFIFPTPSIIPFWMKDMKYPLDIIWIGTDKKVVDIFPNLTPETYPKSFSPKAPAQYVLEVMAGFTEKNKITVGTRVSF